MPSRLSKSEFVDKSLVVHGVKAYDYTHSVYVNNSTKLAIKCNSCGEIFFQRPKSHLLGVGCARCGKVKCRASKTMTTTKYIERCNIVHENRYDYSDTIYKHNTCMVTIICPKHGAFIQEAYSHLKGSGCQRCAGNNFSKKAVKWLDEIARQENISIQHIYNGGEFRIPGTRFKADGYCRSTNTIFEFYGDKWHGNPSLFEPFVQCHPFTNVTAGELYNRTINRETEIKDLGYNLRVLWEHDYDFKQTQESFSVLS